MNKLYGHARLSDYAEEVASNRSARRAADRADPRTEGDGGCGLGRALYGVPTKVLNQAVKRNIERFPEDFMFQLTWEESVKFSRSQIVTLKRGGNVKYQPYAFTEHGVAMLSSILRSPRAIQVNIQIMRTFAKLREIISANRNLARRLDELERKYDTQFKMVFDAIRQLMMPPSRPQRRIGFHVA